jgi:MSHA biogenesis protein MshJ
MNFKDLMASFAKLHLRERLLVVVALAALLYFIVDVALLEPQQNKLKNLQQLDKAHQTELVAMNNALAGIEQAASKSAVPSANKRAALDELKKQIADVDTFFGLVDTTTSEMGALVKEVLNASPGLTLVSLSTLQTEPFYSPPQSKAGGDNKAAMEPAPKTIYKQGVAVSVKGNYLALLSYMENLQKYPKRLFWSDAKLDVSAYPDAVLKLDIYSLSAQPSSALR